MFGHEQRPSKSVIRPSPGSFKLPTTSGMGRQIERHIENGDGHGFALVGEQLQLFYRG